MTPTLKQQSWIKACLFVVALMPFLRLVLGILTNHLGANPLEFITRNTGDWTLYFLCMTLSITPLRQLIKWPWLIKLRRMFGLYAFFYASLHFLTFLWFDHFFDVNEMLKDVVKRPFILVGFTAFILLIPLALTSTNNMIKRLGAKRWQLLHKLIYLIISLSLLHYFWMKAGKHDFNQPILFTSIVLILLLIRIVRRFSKNRIYTDLRLISIYRLTLKSTMQTPFFTLKQAPRFSAKIALVVLNAAGWKLRYDGLPAKRGVMIFYPHTSNWDFLYGILAKWAIAIPLKFLVKEKLFKGVSGFFIGRFMRYWGGEPIERGASNGAITQLTERMRLSDEFWLAMAPEGTRSYQPYWRSGFYHIALAAKVPLVCAFIDYANKEIGVRQVLELTGNEATDLAHIHRVYQYTQGKHPLQQSPIIFKP